MYEWVCFYVWLCIHELMFYTNVYACMFLFCFFALWCHVICVCKVILYLYVLLCNSRFKSSLELMLCVIDISTLNKTYLIWFWVQTLSQVDQLLPVWATFWSYQLSVFPVHTTTYCGFDREQHWSHASEDRPLVYS